MPTVYLVAHTHWDREWYHTAACFRQRLARLVDDLLPLLRARPDFPSFLLDGQAVVLDDYLAARPERAGDLSRLLGEGRIEAGPWYVLADELLVSAEALVRNLLVGISTVRRRGGAPMRVGYSPDAFGHTGAMPLLLRGFGIEVALIWRGFGGEPAEKGDLHRWRSADGSEVVMVHLARPGYEYGAGLPREEPALAERWRALAAILAPRARSPHWLVPCGADHHAAQPDLPEVVEALQRLEPRLSFRLGRLEAYADAVAGWARGHGAELPEVEGELRRGHAHAWALQGAHGSRLYLKQENAACQRLLERYVEPLAALASVRDGRDRRAELMDAWRALLENHPHDSICGTSSDPVHREMLVRFARCRDLADEVLRDAVFAVAGHDAMAARAAGRGAWKPAVLLVNPSPRRRSEVVEASVALFRADVRVGQQGPRVRQRAAPAGLVLRDAAGRAVPHQELERWTGHDLVESPLQYPDCDEVEWRRLAISVEDLPALGVASLSVEERAAGAMGGGVGPDDEVVVEAGALHNARLSVLVEPEGTLAVLDRRSGEVYRGLGCLVDNGDAGDSYTYSAPRPDRVVDAPDEVAVAVVHAGPLRGTLEIVRRYVAIELETRTRVALVAGGAQVALKIAGENRRTDHRLRVAFRLGGRLRRVVADGHFGPAERSFEKARPRGALPEQPAPTAPMQRYVSVAAGARGFTVLADGLPEYEARRDGTLLITLLRAFGEMSRGDLRERPGHAGWPTPTPDAQCLGPFTARLGLLLHDEAALDSRVEIECAAENFHAPVKARMLRSALAIPPRVPGPTLEGDGLVFSAMKPAESGRGVVLRCYNALGRAVRGTWRFPWPLRAAELCRLDEKSLQPLVVGSEGRVEFEAGPRAVVTVLVR